MAKGQHEEAGSNLLLGALEPASRRRIEAHLQPITLKLGVVVCEAGGLLKHAYFPQGNVLSLLTVLENGSAIETANIGREGAFGLFAAMYSRVSFNRCLVQLEGSMVRCPIQLLQAEFKGSEHVRNLFVSYSETLLSGPADGRLQCDAYDRGENVPVAPHDARSCPWRGAALHARIPVLHAGRQSEVGDACRAIDAGCRPDQLSPGTNSNP